MKNKAKVKAFLRNSFAFVAAAIMVLTVFTLAGCSSNVPENPDNGSIVSADSQEKSVTFKIIFEDGSEKSLSLKTQKATLAEALVEAEIIEYSADGFYTTIDGVTADYGKDGSWWCITKNGEMTNYGLNDLKIADGESYEATYTK